MDPQVALHLLATIAQISGTVLAIYVAITIFALQDKTLVKLMQKWSYVFFLFPALSWVITTIGAVVGLSMLDLERPYDDYNAYAIVTSFCVSLFLMLLRFWTIIRVKFSYVRG